MKMKVITFKVDEELLEKLDKFCSMYKINRSAAIRYAINKLLSETYIPSTQIRVKRYVLQ